MDMIQMGMFLSQLRKEKNLTQMQPGERIGVSNNTVFQTLYMRDFADCTDGIAVHPGN